ncbi:Cytochrome c oxidase subunit, partial [Quillaja saponaria]
CCGGGDNSSRKAALADVPRRADDLHRLQELGGRATRIRLAGGRRTGDLHSAGRRSAGGRLVFGWQEVREQATYIQLAGERRAGDLYSARLAGALREGDLCCWQELGGTCVAGGRCAPQHGDLCCWQEFWATCVDGGRCASAMAEVELKTAPADFRFPTTIQTLFHRCLAAKGEESGECERFARTGR